MARKKSSSATKKTSPREPSALPPPAPDRRKPDRGKSYMQQWRETRVAGPEAEKWAKLELKLGRRAQWAGLVAGFVLGLTVLITPNLSADLFAAFRRPDMALWFPLFLTSFAVSGFTLAWKLGPYRSGFRDSHFLSSAVAFVVSIGVMVLAFLDHFYVLDLGVLVLWMYPLSVTGLCLAFVSLALTWEGYGWRKMGSITASLLVLATLIPIPFIGVPAAGLGPSLILVFAYDALLIATSGSLLHLIASSGEASQREIIKASDTRLAELKTEMENKLKALEYKEQAYVEREAHLEAERKELTEVSAELDSRRVELNTVQGKIDQQGRTLADLEGKLAKMRAEVEAQVEGLNLKDKDLKVARGQIEAGRQSLTEREQSLGDREKEVKRQQIEMSSRERAVAAKAKELADLANRLKKEGGSVDTRRDEVIRKEKELQLKDSEVKLKIEQLDAQQAKDVKDRVRELKDWESKILAKDREVGGREVQLRQLQEELNQRQTDGDAYAAALQQERERLAGREQDLNALEKKISDSHATFEEQSAEIDRRWKEVLETQKRLEGREQEYTTLYKDAKLREADFSTTKEEVSRKMAAVDAREAKMKEWQENLGAVTRKMEEERRRLLVQQKALEAKVNQLSLKELELEKQREAAHAVVAPAGGPREMDQEQVWEMREKSFREREDEFKRRMYQKEKEMEARETAVKEQLRAAASAGATGTGEALEATVQVTADRGDKHKTGTPRLDDLLYGGFAMNANILFVGPAFVGKEIAILNFIAEGLKANVPAVIVTTSKPPVEIAKEMAPVLPTFMEYDQLGLVRWIDASGTTPTQKLARDKNTFRVPNAADFEGILTAVNQAEEDFRERSPPYFRFAFLSLSSSLSQADEKAAIGFVQRFANRLRQSKCISAFALERGMHTDQQVESLQQLMDGALVFKQEKSKTMMSVVGVGEVQTRDWVPYKFTNKALMIGSFQLERIR